MKLNTLGKLNSWSTPEATAVAVKRVVNFSRIKKGFLKFPRLKQERKKYV